MIYFFQKSASLIYAIGCKTEISSENENKLKWLLGGAEKLDASVLKGNFIGPRKEMITPWSTNAVEICQNAGIEGIERIENYIKEEQGIDFDPMLQFRYNGLDQSIFTLKIEPEPIQSINNIAEYNEKEGLALSSEEINYLEGISEKLKRPLTDSEIFGFSQINSEHCRHKIFNGKFIIDGEEKPLTLFQLIKKTSQENHNYIVSAYKDNVAFIKGPVVEQFAPKTQDKPDFFITEGFESVISLKAETHNFPTTVEPFNGAATGSGGEIRDRLAGGQGSLPLAGTAVYMTSYPRSDKDRNWEKDLKERKWLYQTPLDILIKASNGASDFGNKYGQPLICGSLLTFEHEENDKTFGYDKVIMLAGGVGFAKSKNAKKQQVRPNETVVVLGGDNYRIGMGGGAVSSVATGEFQNAIELNAVQRSNPEMQKRVANAIRALAEMESNPIISIHDHGAGGHLNCLSELVEETGAEFDLSKFAIGDPTLSDKEIMSNESQERMGLVIKDEDLDYLKHVSERERAPFFEVGKTTDDFELVFKNKKGERPFDLKLNHLFGSSPVTILKDEGEPKKYTDLRFDTTNLKGYITDLLQLEAVASKDWLTNKVDRSVTGKVATQQTVGEIQVPLNNVGVMALDFKNHKGVATSIGHSPIPGLIDSGSGSRLSVAEALTNLVFTPLSHKLKGISLSANWMWPAKNESENKRLYNAVEKLSDFACELGINIPTGKDSLSMTQKYPDGSKVFSPGTVIISTVGEVSDIRKTVTPNIKTQSSDSVLLYVDFSGFELNLGGSSFSQILNQLGDKTPDVSPKVLSKAFNAVQELIEEDKILAGHDISSGGLITTLLEMNFPNLSGGMNVSLDGFKEDDIFKVLFSENPSIIIQVDDETIADKLNSSGIKAFRVGTLSEDRNLNITLKGEKVVKLSIDECRDLWMKSSYLLDRHQTDPVLADLRYQNYKHQPLKYDFESQFKGDLKSLGIDLNRKSNSGIKAAIIREKGVNGDREMAYTLWMAGFDVKDVHMTDLISGREDLKDINMIVFVGGFSNSDVLGSAKGWAGSFLFNDKAKNALDEFYSREDTLSLGVCNGCQVMMELEKVYPEKEVHPKMHLNASGKFESCFANVDIKPNQTIMFGNMSGMKLGIWLAHGEGRFKFEGNEKEYDIPVKYSYDEFPGNPNGSDFSAAAVASKDGRHVAIMPHLERTIFPWNWANSPMNSSYEVSPWILPFINAKNWIKDRI